jgi:hypothetical protein
MVLGRGSAAHDAGLSFQPDLRSRVLRTKPSAGKASVAQADFPLGGLVRAGWPPRPAPPSNHQRADPCLPPACLPARPLHPRHPPPRHPRAAPVGDEARSLFQRGALPGRVATSPQGPNHAPLHGATGPHMPTDCGCPKSRAGHSGSGTAPQPARSPAARLMRTSRHGHGSS